MNALHVDKRAASAPGGADGELPLVLLHGWGMNLRVFDRLRGELPARESWAMDLPGYGRSPWWSGASSFDAQRDALLERMPPRCVLVGWSLGAQFAQSLAAREPQRIGALVLLSATPRFTHCQDWPHGVEAGALVGMRALLEQDWRRVLEDFVLLQVRGSRDADETAHELVGALSAHGHPAREALASGLDLLESVDLRAIVPSIHQPALVVTGLNDRVTMPDAARWLAHTLPAARLLEVPRAGHAPFVSHHVEVAAAIRSWLDENAGAGRA
jgi:pimeloyl-[acyl-carrier protein] methyl ester esterase